MGAANPKAVLTVVKIWAGSAFEARTFDGRHVTTITTTGRRKTACQHRENLKKLSSLLLCVLPSKMQNVMSVYSMPACILLLSELLTSTTSQA
jgi:hypothetical protein